ncbi:hypothetical protein LTR36_006531 [Oleoguttula mirabilis]|uniref:GH16 domain-containing protein n=1 Tax=Oleoguttula mirabilis TaxID=1507867 RepID=A0AAV9JVB8_9PEZI|nr:hypothetical protein LTR36_006531 [Oleoguttula mirabilis]
MLFFGLSLLFATLCTAQQYSLQSSFAGPSFFDNFDFWTAGDPTYGYVHYVDQAVAEQYGMINTANNAAVWGVDTTQTLDPTANLGRLSIRLTSIQSWTHGLFILDLEHMPANQCGVWPAFWTLGSGVWPDNGEIDIIEFTNTVPNNQMALHTTASPNCTIAGSGQTGTLLTHNCANGDSYTGCGVAATTPHTIGYEFDTAAGGVYAMEWTSTAIQIWFFPRGGIPESILEANDTVGPDPSTFGLPVANFQGSCDIDAHFYNHSIVFDTTFCGSYAGNLWAGAGCPLLDPSNGWQSCNDFVAANPQAFTDAYWEVNYLQIYQTVAGAVAPISSSLSSVVPVAKTSSVPTLSGNAEGRPTTPTMHFPVSLTSSTTRGNTVTPPSAATTSLDTTAVISLPTTTSFAPTGPSTFATSVSSATGSSSLPAAVTSSSSSASVGTTNFVVVVQTVTITNPGIPSPHMDVARQEPMSMQDRRYDPHLQVVERTTTHWPELLPPADQSSPTSTQAYLTRREAHQPDDDGIYQPWATSADGVNLPPGAPLPPPNTQSPRAAMVPSLPSATIEPEKHAATPEKHDAERQIIPGGTVGFCSVPGSSCNEHHKRDAEVEDSTDWVGGVIVHEHPARIESTESFLQTPSPIVTNTIHPLPATGLQPIMPYVGPDGIVLEPNGKCDAGSQSRAAQGGDWHRMPAGLATGIHGGYAHTERPDQTLEVPPVEPYVPLSGGPVQEPPKEQRAAPLAGANAKPNKRREITDYSVMIVTVVVTETVPAYSSTMFSFDPVTKGNVAFSTEPATLPSARQVIDYTPTHLSYDPQVGVSTVTIYSTVYNTILFEDLAKRDDGVLAATSAGELTEAHHKPSSTATATHHLGPYTCTPVVMLQAAGVPVNVGCLGPQHAILPPTESLRIANVTSTITNAGATGYPKLANPNSLLSDYLDEAVVGGTDSTPVRTRTTVVVVSCVAAVLTWWNAGF